jgi:multicomponent Na+:H+ antiporter subunit F
VAVIRDERMLALVGAIALSAGNAGMMLLAHLLREVET